jgi:hypothetical protein
VVVLDGDERQRCFDAGARPEPILLDEFMGSKLDLMRSHWLTAQRLDQLSNDDALALVGAALRYSTNLIVADKMIGVSLKTRDGRKDTPYHRAERVRNHLAGVAFLVDAWHRASPFVGQTPLKVEVITVAGSSGARGGNIDPAELKTAISRAADDLGVRSRIGALKVTLKQDSEPKIFNDRLLVCGGRTWGLQHGLVS